MFARMAVVAGLIALSACAGVESAGRNASRAPQAAPVTRSAPAPTPAPAAATLPAPQPAPSPAVVAPTPQASAPLTVPPASVAARPQPEPIPAPTPTPSVAAPDVRVPTSTTPPPRPRNDGDDVVVPGQAQEQVRAPDGDFRSREQRNEDIRAWDRCVSSVQAVYERDPMRPQLDSPEDYCSQSLGMANRNAIPESRLQRVRR